ncbi:PRTase-like protein [Tilletiopsis washingtonensis]|uniref:adenine phosphoribosyltransferase n=1 Tax=Tilletiopsis washingtonensis TaxID=58919 RepID=A0A316Z1X4_9BASI|nr:PRTase-like protein [Tilletiopsis washingtonensis]PWN94968.1 PRTase-like protein [Tilletiopsis washingtonensis]
MSAPGTADAPDIAFLRKHLVFYPDYPKKGVNFVDIFPLLRTPLAFEGLITHLLSHIFTVTLPRLPDGQKIDAVVGLDARGFLFGPVLAQRLGAAFVPVRKAGKLPGTCEQATYEKEYGTDVFEAQAGSLPAGANVIVVDDLIATGGSAKAAGELVAKLGGKTLEYLFVVDIPFLQGASKLDAPSYAMIDVD